MEEEGLRAFSSWVSFESIENRHHEITDEEEEEEESGRLRRSKSESIGMGKKKSKNKKKNGVLLEGYVDEDVARTKSLTDEDLDELKGCLDLGFGFSYHEIPELCNTLPALELCYSMSQKSHPSIANWRISSPGISSYLPHHQNPPFYNFMFANQVIEVTILKMLKQGSNFGLRLSRVLLNSAAKRLTKLRFDLICQQYSGDCDSIRCTPILAECLEMPHVLTYQSNWIAEEAEGVSAVRASIRASPTTCITSAFAEMNQFCSYSRDNWMEGVKREECEAMSPLWAEKFSSNCSWKDYLGLVKLGHWLSLKYLGYRLKKLGNDFVLDVVLFALLIWTHYVGVGISPL